MKGGTKMTEMEQRRKELDRLIISKNFNLSDNEIIKRALELENSIKNTGSR